MNIGKVRSLLRRAEQVLGLVEGKRHGHHRHHHRRGRKSRVGNEVLRQVLRRIR
jgi:hypothetical protein